MERRRGNPHFQAGRSLQENEDGVLHRRTYNQHEARSQERNDFHMAQRRNRTLSASSDQTHQQRSFSGFRGGQQHRGRNYNRGGSYNRGRDHNDEGGRNLFANWRAHNNGQRSVTENGDNASNSRGRRPMGFKALQSLLEKDSEELIMELMNSKKGFHEFLKTNLSNDGIVLFTRVLRKVSDSSFDDCKYKIIQTYFDEPFVGNLTRYIVFLPMQSNSDRQKNKFFWENTDDFWNNVIKISNDILDFSQTFAMKVLPQLLKSLTTYIPTFENIYNYHVSDEIKNNAQRLCDAVDALIKEKEEKEKAQVKQKISQEVEEEPPDDFRQISVYPNSHELLSTHRGYLRNNVIKGPYRDVNHYLDVQFRLLREDFIGPLRSGIASYRSESTKRVENVKIYKKVRFLNSETINEHFCMRVKFDFGKKKKNFSYENSRRFMFGSLICFTMDNFKTFIFGKVSERKMEDLEKGELIVGFDQNITVLFNIDYVMIECSVYFEPYYHVLNVLKNMTVENFPMEKYIINVDSSVQPPEYLTGPNTGYVVENFQFSPLINWPSRRFYNFNESQLRAFKAALTQEFTIIQGPPGTGKTYLGLKIAKTLLENRDLWYKQTPMLVICYTNHALDQFLEGIVEFTNKIMRVGGQSKNEKLQSFNLKNRSRFKMNPAVFQQRDEVQRILTKIKNVNENLKQINFYHSIRAFDVFEEIIPNYTKTWFYRRKRDEILAWLLGKEKQNITNEALIDPHLVPIQEQLSSMNINDSDDEDQEEESDDDSFQDSETDLQFNDDDIFEEILNDVRNLQCSIPLLTQKSMYDRIVNLETALASITSKWKTEPPTFEELIEEEKYRSELTSLMDEYQILTRRLEEGKRKQLIEEKPHQVDLLNPHRMTLDDRWRLYFYWLNIYKKKLEEKLNQLNQDFRAAYRIYEQIRDIEDTNAMKDVYVVGMTTTGAARLRSTLQTLKSPIVIVEEAAEVLEAHIITSLTKHCQHLILIGDHQQLKPSTADYGIEKHYNLGISLFERMVLNNIQRYTLNVQHRMRPEIANLIRPFIYPDLEDDPSVTERLPIRGIDNNLYFIDHTQPEENCEGTSKKNYHEVKFLICLAKHLILNGYKPENVTILAAYLGQMFELQKEKKKHKAVLENVRISVLDNYQGEECDIILLSLVRNNQENSIGFLSIENRVCVALSRARNGFYLMGNMNQLCNVSPLWQQIRQRFEEQNALVSELPLRCQIHRETVTYVKTATDFLAIPEGGCGKKCDADLVCGHKCPSLCHILNRDHVNYQCRMICGKNLCDENEKHTCRKMCYQECGPCNYLVQRKLPCLHVVEIECHENPYKYDCPVLVSTQLPCGHVADKPCFIDPISFRCPHPCDTKVEPCGHACIMRCHARRDPDHLEYKCRKSCARYRKGCTVQTEKHLCQKYCYEECQDCTIVVRKPRTVCPHFYDVACNFDVDSIECEKPCTKILDCGHKCRNKCKETCGKCEVAVDKVLAKCGHTVKSKCSEEPNPKSCNKKCPLKLACGHLCTTKCNEPCTTECKAMVDCNLKASCGHVVTRIRCSVARSNPQPQDLLKYCNKPCQDQLKCGHRCSGSCGQCSQGRIHKRCNEKCGVPLVCDHPCEFPCRQACRPCKRNCEYKCQHSVCRKKCGDVCTLCKERCTRRCEHQQCSKFCGDVCNVPPCEEPCKKMLRKCGHPCIGFCGDPCPPKCMVCDKEELTEIFFGYEAEDARYVVLKDCGHVFENTGLEHWLQQNKDQISFKTCPLCKTPIKTTQRYSDHVKRAMADVAKVKAKSSGTFLENEKMRLELITKAAELARNSELLTGFCPELMKVFITIEKRLKSIRHGKRQPINKHELNSITSKLQIVEHIIKICYKTNIGMDDIYIPQVQFISKALIREEDLITDQEIDDINYELNRLSRIVELNRLRKSPNFKYHFANNARVKDLVARIELIIFNRGKFYEDQEESVRQWLTELNRWLASAIGISESEKREIVKAMRLSKGHWYKCPNGHPYAIGECGGAMQESHCNECGEKIGGTHHRLISTNAVATEMDGATYGAWSEAANMANYNLADLQ